MSLATFFGRSTFSPAMVACPPISGESASTNYSRPPTCSALRSAVSAPLGRATFSCSASISLLPLRDPTIEVTERVRIHPLLVRSSRPNQDLSRAVRCRGLFRHARQTGHGFSLTIAAGSCSDEKFKITPSRSAWSRGRSVFVEQAAGSDTSTTYQLSRHCLAMRGAAHHSSGLVVTG